MAIVSEKLRKIQLYANVLWTAELCSYSTRLCKTTSNKTEEELIIAVSGFTVLCDILMGHQHLKKKSTLLWKWTTLSCGGLMAASENNCQIKAEYVNWAQHKRLQASGWAATRDFLFESMCVCVCVWERGVKARESHLLLLGQIFSAILRLGFEPTAPCHTPAIPNIKNSLKLISVVC